MRLACAEGRQDSETTRLLHPASIWILLCRVVLRVIIVTSGQARCNDRAIFAAYGIVVMFPLDFILGGNCRACRTSKFDPYLPAQDLEGSCAIASYTHVRDGYSHIVGHLRALNSSVIILTRPKSPLSEHTCYQLLWSRLSCDLFDFDHRRRVVQSETFKASGGTDQVFYRHTAKRVDMAMVSTKSADTRISVKSMTFGSYSSKA